MITGGFFNKEEIGEGKIIKRLTGCGACGLNKGCISPKMKAAGKGKKGILIVSEFPCAEESTSGRLMRGDNATWLKKKLNLHGINMEKDCVLITAVSCRPPKGRIPSANEIAMCRSLLQQEIEYFNPKTILLLGNIALESFLGDVWKGTLGGIVKWRGFVIPDRATKAWVAPLFHPSYVIKSVSKKSFQYNPVIGMIFDQDLERALTQKSFPPFESEKDIVQIITNPDDLLKELKKINRNKPPVAFDFETTGLKPHAKGHKIISCALSTNLRHSIAFPMPLQGPAAKQLRMLLEDSAIPLRAHNIKFETSWAKVRFRTIVRGWEWDSMLAAHILDNRKGITGLKFQVYVNFGVVDYSSHMSNYLKGDGGANSLNRIKEASLRDVLLYNGLDSLFQFRLSSNQMPLIGGFNDS